MPIWGCKMEEQNKLIKYDNKINNLDFDGFKPSDMDLFMAICYSIGNRGTNRIELKYSDMMQLARYRHVSLDDFHGTLKKTFRQKIFGLSFGIDTQDEYEGWVLFDYYSANRKKQILTLEVSAKAEKFFNNVIKNFTLLDLAIYGKLQRKYSKFLYQHLCQFRKAKTGGGWWQVGLEELKYLFSTPAHYTNTEIKKEVINPSIEELKPYMTISYDTIKEKGKVCAYKFTFKEVKQKLIEPKEKVIVTEDKSEVIPKSMGEIQEKAIDEDAAIENMKKLAPKLSTRDCMNIYDTAMENNTDLQDVYSIIDYACNQQTDNLVGYIISIIKKGYSVPVRTSKKNSFNVMDSRDIEEDEDEIFKRDMDRKWEEVQKNKKYNGMTMEELEEQIKTN